MDSFTFDVAVDVDDSPQRFLDIDILADLFLLPIENVIGSARVTRTSTVFDGKKKLTPGCNRK